MKFAVNLETFKNSFVVPSFVSDAKGSIALPSAGFITMQASKVGIKMFAFNGSLGVCSEATNALIPDLDYVCNEEGSITIKPEDFIASLDSFPPKEKIEINADDKVVSISQLSDPEQKQELPLGADSVTLPTLAASYKKTLTINREILCKAMKKVMFAMGYEKSDEGKDYLCIRIVVDEDKFTVYAGTGARFILFHVEGKLISKSDEKMEIFLPREEVIVLSKLLENLTADDITIKQADKANTAPDQIVVEAEGFKSIIVGFSPDFSWPSLDKFLKADNPVIFTAKASELVAPVKGIRATYDDEARKQNEIHIADLKLDFDDKLLYIDTQTNSGLRSKRKIYLDEIKENKNNLAEINMAVFSHYLAEMVKCIGSDDGLLQIELSEAKRPIILINFPTKVNDSKGITETTKMFFAQAKK